MTGAQRGFVEVPFKQYVAFDGIHTSSTRFTIATQSLDRVWMCWRDNTKSNQISEPIRVNGHNVWYGDASSATGGKQADES